MITRKSYDGTFINSKGVDVVKSMTLPGYMNVIAYRSFLNPVDYNGQFSQEIKDNYRTNELGFFIVLLFFGALSQSFMSYRKFSLLNQKKRFAFQQYRRSKFLEDSLRLKSRHEIIHEKVGRTYL